MGATICCPLTMSLYYCYKSYKNTNQDKSYKDIEIIKTEYGKTIKHKEMQRH